MAQNKYMAQSLYDEKKEAKKASSSRSTERSGAVSDSQLRSEFQRYKRDTEIELEELRRRGSPATGTGTPGAPGKDGKDGVGIRSVTQEVVSEESGGENVVAVELTDSSSYRFTVRNGKQGAKGDAGSPGAKGDKGDAGAPGKDGTDGADGKDGTNGKDGVNGISCTHSWNGTVLTVTSASGTTSADLKGEKGDTGATGAQGEKGETGAAGKNGADGKTPQRGTDYWTDSDIASMKSYLETVILNGEW